MNFFIYLLNKTFKSKVSFDRIPIKAWNANRKNFIVFKRCCVTLSIKFYDCLCICNQSNQFMHQVYSSYNIYKYSLIAVLEKLARGPLARENKLKASLTPRQSFSRKVTVTESPSTRNVNCYAYRGYSHVALHQCALNQCEPVPIKECQPVKLCHSPAKIYEDFLLPVINSHSPSM